jgi:hypothetical protein
MCAVIVVAFVSFCRQNGRGHHTTWDKPVIFESLQCLIGLTCLHCLVVTLQMGVQVLGWLEAM